MTAKNRDYEMELRNLLEALSESVLEMPEEDLIAELGEEGSNPSLVAESTRALLRDVARTLRQRNLHRAREEYTSRLAALQKKEYNLPVNAEERRNLLAAILANQPELRSALTAQYRELTHVPDEDIETCLKQLIELGVADSQGRPLSGD